jgi:hypothetical protein
MKKVRRNAHKKIAAILDQVTEVKVYSLDNGFTGEVIEFNKEYLLDVLTRMHSSLMDNENGTYTIDVHSNLWYNLDTEVIENVILEEVAATTEESNQVESIEVTEEVNTVSEQQIDSLSVSYQLNDEKQGVEIYFNDKPSEDVRNQMKALGFRWGKFKKCWYAKQSKETIALAEQLAGEQTTNEPIEYSYPEIEIDDNDSYIINQSLQDREHDANWIFRQNKRDHNKELQELFTEYTNSVKEIISNIDNQYYIYKIKSSLQSFKKKYHQAYINWLSAKASQPHWAVSGRGNLSKSRYDKALNRQDKWMNELVNLPKELESKIDYYETKIVNEKAAAIREAVKNTNVELVFKTITKEGMRFYNYGDYTINKNWGTFRIYHNGKEVHAMRTTETLKDAKKYVAYLVQSQSIAI